MGRGFPYQLRRDTAANWTSANSAMLAGEPGFETDTGLMKIGDGTNTWNDLPYASVIPSFTPASSSDTGLPNQICYDGSYLYICIAANTWRRIAHLTW